MVDELVIVAAPSGTGKTTLCRMISGNRLPEINRRLGVGDFSEFRFMSRNQRPDHPVTEGSWLLEYNTPRRYREPMDYVGDACLEVLAHAREVSIVTLWCPPRVLLRRRLGRDLRKRLRGPLVHTACLPFIYVLLSALSRRRREQFVRDHSAPSTQLLEMYESFYRRPERIVENYNCWLQFCDREIAHARSHLIVQFDRRLRILGRDQWMGMVNGTKGLDKPVA